MVCSSSACCVFEPRLRIQQRAAALFQPFVRDAQFFLLNLQLLVQLLRLDERVLQALAIQRRLEEVAHAAGDQLQELLVALDQWRE